MSSISSFSLEAQYVASPLKIIRDGLEERVKIAWRGGEV